jgi:hypothetical protein
MTIFGRKQMQKQRLRIKSINSISSIETPKPLHAGESMYLYLYELIELIEEIKNIYIYQALRGSVSSNRPP